MLHRHLEQYIENICLYHFVEGYLSALENSTQTKGEARINLANGIREFNRQNGLKKTDMQFKCQRAGYYHNKKQFKQYAT